MRERWNLIVGGRRSGKTFLAILWLFVQGMMNHGQTGTNIWLAPTMKQSKIVGMAALLYATRNMPRKLVEVRHSDCIVTIAGERYIFGSTDNIDSIRGNKIKRIAMDEAAYNKEYAWQEVVRPALADLQGHALLESTYKGFNWFYDLSRDRDRWNVAVWPTHTNPMIAPEELSDMRASMDEQTYKQEILALPTTAKGLVFEKVFGEWSIIPRRETITTGMRYALAMDFGYNDPTTVGLYEYSIPGEGMSGLIVRKLAELEYRQTQIETVIRDTVKLCEGKGLNLKAGRIDLACDIAGNQHTGAGKYSYVDRLERCGLFRLHYKKTSKVDAVNFMRAMFTDADGVHHFQVCEDCRKSIESYTGYEIKDGERPLDDSRYDHHPDTDEYFFENIIKPKLRRREQVRKTRRLEKPDMRNCCECGERFLTYYQETRFCQRCEEHYKMEVVT